MNLNNLEPVKSGPMLRTWDMTAPLGSSVAPLVAIDRCKMPY